MAIRAGGGISCRSAAGHEAATCIVFEAPQPTVNVVVWRRDEHLLHGSLLQSQLQDVAGFGAVADVVGAGAERDLRQYEPL